MFNNVYRRHHFHPVFECFAEVFIFQWPTVPWQLCTRWWFLVNVFFSILRRSFPIFRRLFSMLWDNSKYWEVLFSISRRWFKISWTSFLIYCKDYLYYFQNLVWYCEDNAQYYEDLFSILFVWVILTIVNIFFQYCEYYS